MKTTKKIKLIPMCNHCFMVALKRKYFIIDGKKSWGLYCPSCKQKY